MNIPKWFATKDWNFLLSNFTATPSYLAIILNINRPVFRKPLMYDHLDLEANLLRDTFRENLDFSHNGKSVSFSSLSPELRLLTTIMFHNLYLLSSIGHMNLGRALFLYDWERWLRDASCDRKLERSIIRDRQVCLIRHLIQRRIS